MKKRLFLFGGLLLACSGLLLCGTNKTVSVRAEEPEVVEPEYNVSFTAGSDENGTVSYEVVGDECIISITPNEDYKISKVWVNDEIVVPDENGVYKFAVISGDYNISVTYSLDLSWLKELAGEELNPVVDAVENGDWSELFTPENIALLFNYVINMGYGLALIITNVKSGKYKNLDRAEIVKEIKSAVPENIQNIVSELVDNQILPVVTDLKTQTDNVTNALKTFIQGFVYNLEGTDEAKQGVIKLLSGINLADGKSIEEVTKFFEEKIAKIQAEFDDKIKLLEEFKATNEDAVAKLDVKVEDEKHYDGTSI